MDITDEMRRMVRRQDCELYGHKFDLINLIGGTDVPNPNDVRGFPMPMLRARDVTKLPHITCETCGAVWLVIDDPGDDYDDAVEKLAQRVKNVKPGAVKALEPNKVPGVDGEPIPMPEGKTLEDLPPEHPAVLFEQNRQAELAATASAEESEARYQASLETTPETVDE